jgi:hypothetical protein
MEPTLILRAPQDYIVSLVNKDAREEWEREEREYWQLIDELAKNSFQVFILRPYTGEEMGGGGVDLPDVLIALTSGLLGATVTSFYQLLIRYLSRHDNRELTVERGDRRLTIKGRSSAEERVLIRQLFPELLERSQQDRSTGGDDNQA